MKGPEISYYSGNPNNMQPYAVSALHGVMKQAYNTPNSTRLLDAHITDTPEQIPEELFLDRLKHPNKTRPGRQENGIRYHGTQLVIASNDDRSPVGYASGAIVETKSILNRIGRRNKLIAPTFWLSELCVLPNLGRSETTGLIANYTETEETVGQGLLMRLLENCQPDQEVVTYTSNTAPTTLVNRIGVDAFAVEKGPSTVTTDNGLTKINRYTSTVEQVLDSINNVTAKV